MVVTLRTESWPILLAVTLLGGILGGMEVFHLKFHLSDDP